MKKTLTLLLISIGVFGYSQEFYYLDYSQKNKTVIVEQNTTNTNTLFLERTNTQVNNMFVRQPLFIELDFNSDLLLFSTSVDLFLEPLKTTDFKNKPYNTDILRLKDTKEKENKDE